MSRERDAILSVQRFVAGLFPAPWDIRLTVEDGREPERPYALIEQIGDAGSAGSKNLQWTTIGLVINTYLPKATSRGAANDAALDVRDTLFSGVKHGPDPRRPTTDKIPLFTYQSRPQTQRLRVRGAVDGTFSLELPLLGGPETTGPINHDVAAAALQDAIDDTAPDVILVEPRAGGVFDLHFVGDDYLGVDHELITVDASDLDTDTQPTVTQTMAAAAAPWRTDRDFISVDDFNLTTIRDQEDPRLLQVAANLRCTFARGLPLPFGQMLLERITATGSNGG